MTTRAELMAEARRRGLVKDSLPGSDVDRAALIAEAKRRKLIDDDFEGEEKSVVKSAMKQFGSGAVESLADTVGFLPDMVLKALRGSGVPIPGDDRTIRDFYAGNGQVLSGAPDGSIERLARGAGRGVVDAATLFAPAGMVAGAARAGSLSSKIAGLLASSPKMQAAAGAIGGGVAEETGSPLGGAIAGMATPAVSSLARTAPQVARAMPGVVGRALVPNSSNVTGGALGGIIGASSGDPIQAAAYAMTGQVTKEAIDSLIPWLRNQVATGRLNMKDALILQAKIAGTQSASAQKQR